MLVDYGDGTLYKNMSPEVRETYSNLCEKLEKLKGATIRKDMAQSLLKQTLQRTSK